MEDINIQELLQYFMQKKFILVIIIATCLVVGNVYSAFIQKPLYRSTTSMVLVSEENTSSSITQNDILLNNNLLSTYSEIITSRTVLADVKANLKLNDSIESLSNCITVSSVANTQLIKISVVRDKKEEAKIIADETAKVFSKKITSIYKIQNISIVDKAQMPTKAYNKNIIKQNLIIIIIGLILSFIIIFIIYYFDTTIKDTKIIEDKLDLVIFGSVPKVGDGYVSK